MGDHHHHHRPCKPIARTPLKKHPDRSDWRDQLWENCTTRIRESREKLLWKFRRGNQDVVKSTFRDIVCDELDKIKRSSCKLSSQMSMSCSSDPIWEFDGIDLESSRNESNDCIQIMIEMERILHEDLAAEIVRRDTALLENYQRILKDEDDYLSQAILEHMQLNDVKVNPVWCPVCTRGCLQETQHVIYCRSCKLQLDLQSEKVNMENFRNRLGEALDEHMNRGCKMKPHFCQDEKYGLTALYIKCEACDLLEIVM